MFGPGSWVACPVNKGYTQYWRKRCGSLKMRLTCGKERASDILLATPRLASNGLIFSPTYTSHLRDLEIKPETIGVNSF